LRLEAEPVRLDDLFNDENPKVYENVAFITSADPAVDLEDLDALELTLQLLEKLKNAEKDIVTRRFGLHGRKPETLEMIGATYGVTRERIRQIEVKALNQLRSRARTYC
jgi:DNA-directed RNA polymerase sigma subunit (sigma70/sigma32)